jgi:malate synthase
MKATTVLENNVVESQPQAGILTSEAQAFLSKLAARFEPRWQELLTRRRTVQQEIDHGKFPDFLPETAEIRQSEWKVAPIPKDFARQTIAKSLEGDYRPCRYGR